MNQKDVDWRQMFIVAMSDLAYAEGVIEGLGHDNTYISERVSSMHELLGLGGKIEIKTEDMGIPNMEDTL